MFFKPFVISFFLRDARSAANCLLTKTGIGLCVIFAMKNTAPRYKPDVPFAAELMSTASAVRGCFSPTIWFLHSPTTKWMASAVNWFLPAKTEKNANALAELADAAVSAAQKRGILTENALVTFVPRSPEKKIRTGVDQAEELAKAVAKRTGLPFYSLLARQNTGTEQKMLNPSRRKENADNAYSLLPYPLKRIQGATILLLDDVVTTGATVNACTVLLKEAGAARVICLAAAKSIKSYRESMRHPH